MKQRFGDSQLVADWYEIKQVSTNLFCVDEQDHVAFFVLKNEDRGLFVDSGLGLVEENAKKLLNHLEIKSFDVLATHAHCDHVGLNYLAKNIMIFEDEWKKYLELKEEKQIDGYYSLLKEDMPWTKDITTTPSQMSW